MSGISFADYISVGLVHTIGVAMGVFVILVILYELVRWRPMLSPIGRAAVKLGPAKWWSIFIRTVMNDMVYQQISPQCGRIKWASHALVFWGFLALIASTTTNYIINPSGAWLPLTNIVRVLGNLGAVLLSLGLCVIVYRARFDENKREYTFASDYLFIGLLLLATLTGWLTELTGEFQAIELIYGVYAIHLLVVAALLCSAPFTSFVHAIGRPVIRLSERYAEALIREGFLKPADISSMPLLSEAGRTRCSE